MATEWLPEPSPVCWPESFVAKSGVEEPLASPVGVVETND